MAFSASASPDLKFAKVKSGGHTQPMERRVKRDRVKSRMEANKKAAKKRDGRKCRWHEPHRCYGQLESDHVEPLGMGGDKQGIRSETRNLFTGCTGIHQVFDQNFTNGLAWVEELEPGKGCDGILRGMRKMPIFRDGVRTDEYEAPQEVWREVRVGVPAKETRAK